MGEKLETLLGIAWDKLGEIGSIASEVRRHNMAFRVPESMELDYNGQKLVMTPKDGAVQVEYTGPHSTPLDPTSLVSGIAQFTGNDAIVGVKVHANPDPADMRDARHYGIISNLEKCGIVQATAVLPLGSYPMQEGIEVRYQSEGDNHKENILMFRSIWSIYDNSNPVLDKLGGDPAPVRDSRQIDDHYQAHRVANLLSPLETVGQFIERMESYRANIQSSVVSVRAIHALARAGDISLIHKPSFIEVSYRNGASGLIYQFEPYGSNGETLRVNIDPSNLARASVVFEGLGSLKR